MLKVYNKDAITRQQRFQNAVLVGVLAAAASIVLMVLIARMTFLHLQILYLASGYAIGTLICRYGRGVQIQFAILAAALAGLVIIICDLLIYGSFAAVLSLFAENSIDILWTVGYRLAALIIAWQTSRIAA